jgi:putative nucleotidyltransferase with HDIG domain
MKNEIQFASFNIDDFMIGHPLPVSIFVYIDFKFITYRHKNVELDKNDFDRLTQRKIKQLFIKQAEIKIFQEWSNKFKEEQKSNLSPKIQEVREDAHRKYFDIFNSNHPDKVVQKTLNVSKNLVLEIMKNPFNHRKLNTLQTYSKGTVDHSVNVSVLATYLGMQIGYTHQLILQHLGQGALLHDIGKSLISFSDNESKESIEKKLAVHPLLGRQLLEKEDQVPEEVLKIVEQHHENFDGSGFPNRLKRQEIYDLARIVAIANAFDELVGNGTGTLQDRHKFAIRTLDDKLYRKFDPVKLEKCLKILKLGI